MEWVFAFWELHPQINVFWRKENGWQIHPRLHSFHLGPMVKGVAGTCREEITEGSPAQIRTVPKGFNVRGLRHPLRLPGLFYLDQTSLAFWPLLRKRNKGIPYKDCHLWPHTEPEIQTNNVNVLQVQGWNFNKVGSDCIKVLVSCLF